MTNAELKFILVEDSDKFRTEILNQLAQAEFEPGNRLGIASTYEDAKDLLSENAAAIDVVFLDLNIPRMEGDPKPEDKHGMELLKLIHHDLNKQPGVDLRVIVISGQDLATNDSMRDMMLEHYAPTLVGVVQKADLTIMLRANLKRLRKDPTAAAIRRCGLPLIPEWETMTDTSKPALARLSAARTIAIRVAQNEIDYREGRQNSHPEFDDNLGGIHGYLFERFAEDKRTGKRLISTNTIKTAGRWGKFLWRGVLMEHFRLINSYWNAYKHLSERPYHNPTQDADEWHVPGELIERGNDGETIVKLVELAVRDLLEWYLPWHEQVLAKH